MNAISKTTRILLFTVFIQVELLTWVFDWLFPLNVLEVTLLKQETPEKILTGTVIGQYWSDVKVTITDSFWGIVWEFRGHIANTDTGIELE